MRTEGETEIVTLGRAGFAGSQRYGAAIWSGDIPSTWEALRQQVRAGLNIGLSGIPWWTNDVGGFFGGQVASEEFRELLVRWFQFGAFCPLLRLHGWRDSSTDDFQSCDPSRGGPNEVWSYGEQVYSILRDYLQRRERLKPYILEQMAVASEKGHPLMRPLLFDFPNDVEAALIDDQFMFGPDLQVAPILAPHATSRRVYLPHDAEWTDAWTGQVYSGGQTIEALAPLDRLPLFLRDGRDLPIR
jgi:alpha-D-xyloside xylohydrolase